jgi:hypothetical protein
LNLDPCDLRGLRFEPEVEDKAAAKEAEEEERERRTMERTLSNKTYRTHVGTAES